MKKLIVFALLFSIAALSFIACKKGSSDPFISFRSRQARLCGTWNVSAYTRNAKDMLTRTDTMPSGGAQGACGWLTNTFDTLATITYIFYNDGRFEARGDTIYNVTKKYTVPGAAGCRDTSGDRLNEITLNEGGTWMWGGAAGTFKNEEELLLSDYNHLGAEDWEIVELKYKEMKLERAATDSTSGKSVIYDMTLTRTK